MKVFLFLVSWSMGFALPSCREQAKEQVPFKRPTAPTEEEEKAIKALEKKKANFNRVEDTILLGKDGRPYWAVAIFDSEINDEDVKLLTKISAVRVIHLSCTNVTREGLKVIFAIPGLRFLSLTGPSFSGAPGFSDDDVAGITRLTQLISLSLDDTKITAKTLSRLRENRNLTHLSLMKTSTNDEGLKEISELPHLDHLDLSDTAITNNGLRHLAKNKSLRYLDVYGTLVSDEGIKFLSESASIGALSLGRTQVTDEGMKYCKLFPRLYSLDLVGLEITDRGLGFLEPVTSLKEIHLGDTKVTKQGVAKLQKALPALVVLGYRSK